jgi:hypothetical protein
VRIVVQHKAAEDGSVAEVTSWSFIEMRRAKGRTRSLWKITIRTEGKGVERGRTTRRGRRGWAYVAYRAASRVADLTVARNSICMENIDL